MVRLCRAGLAEGVRLQRAVLRLAGEDTEQFLQGLLTNDVAQLRPGHLQYAALLNSSGRVLHDLFLQRVPGEEHTILCDVSRESAGEVLRLLRRYKLRARVDVTDVSSEHGVWAASGQAEGSATPSPWPADPRLPELGRRAILHEAAASGLAAPAQPQPEPGASYRRERYGLGVAEGEREMPPGAAIPLEYNLEGLNAISFAKGCYVGQELVARTHFRGAVRKRVVPVSAVAGALEAGQDILEPGAAKPVGRVLAVAGTSGLAMLRLAALPSSTLTLADSGAAVRAHRPAWWPGEWTAG